MGREEKAVVDIKTFRIGRAIRPAVDVACAQEGAGREADGRASTFQWVLKTSPDRLADELLDFLVSV